MSTNLAHTHSLRRARAHFSILSLLGMIATSAAFAPAIQAAEPDTKPDSAGGGATQRPAKRENLKTDQRRPPGPLALFDTDRDGRISAAEIAAAPAALRKLDTDGDGQLAGHELHPPRPPRPPGAPDGGPEGPPRHRHPPGPPPEAPDSAP
jgi:hypothetical protein